MENTKRTTTIFRIVFEERTLEVGARERSQMDRVRLHRSREKEHHFEGYPLSDDERCEVESAEVSKGEFYEDQCKKSGQKLDDYIRSLAWRVEQKVRYSSSHYELLVV